MVPSHLDVAWNLARGSTCASCCGDMLQARNEERYVMPPRDNARPWLQQIVRHA